MSKEVIEKINAFMKDWATGWYREDPYESAALHKRMKDQIKDLASKESKDEGQ